MYICVFASFIAKLFSTFQNYIYNMVILFHHNLHSILGNPNILILKNAYIKVHSLLCEI